MTAESGAGHWKQKYFDSLEELEAKERDWGQLESLLRQMVSRLTLAADPAEKQLVKLLDQLRQDIRRDAPLPRLQSRFEEINQAILALDNKRKQQAQALDLNTGLSQVLDQIDLPQGVRRKGKALQKQLASAKPDDDPTPLIAAFSKLYQESLEWLQQEEGQEPTSTTESNNATGLFRKIFSSGDQAGTDSDESLRLAGKLLAQSLKRLSVPESQANALGRLTRDAEQFDNAQALHDWSDSLSEWIKDLQSEHQAMPANEALIQLLEHIDLPEEFIEEVERLKERLAGDLTEASLSRSMTDMADLIARARTQVQEEKNEIEAFLADLTTRLTKIDETLEGGVRTREEAVVERKAFDDKMSLEVQGIEDTVNHAKDLNDLKTAIRTRIDAIQDHMQHYRDMESSREERAQTEIEELSRQLDTFQGEVSTLHNKLEVAREKATHDSLTGLPNRLAYEDRISEEIERARRYKHPLTLAVLDVDFFKKINDSYGHPAGDNVLKILSELFRKRTRESDFIARFGGEEFMLILTETDADSALSVADKLRQTVEEANFHFRENRVPVTISCGLTGYREGDDKGSLYERADTALYDAKDSGRNRCILK
jgi:diguanylate cyclase